MFDNIGDGYYLKVVPVPQVPVDNNKAIVIVYHIGSGMYESSNRASSTHKNKEIALNRLKERVSVWLANFEDNNTKGKQHV